MAGNELWRLFESHCCSRTELLNRVSTFLDPQDLANLRLANLRLRDAVSCTVEEVHCTLHNGSCHGDLTQAFPAATKLALCMRPLGTRGSRVPAADCFVFLQHIAAVNAGLLQRLSHLKLELTLDWDGTTSVRLGLGSFLTRCTKLEGLEVRWLGYEDYLAGSSSNVARFAGQGSTPAERQASMRQQLLSMASSPEFLAPASWPDHTCLTKLQLRPGLAAQTNKLCSVMRSCGLLTPSLASLAVHTAQASELAECQGLSRLSRLTALQLYAGARDDGTCLRELLQELASLPSLQYLGTDNHVLDSASAAAADELIPSSWSQLSRLTHLSLFDLRVPMGSLSRLRSLRHLHLGDCTTLGSLSQLFALTALTSLEANPCVVGTMEEDTADGGAATATSSGPAAAGAVPQAWREQLRDLCWQFDWADMHIVSQLTALTSLTLMKPEVGPELCWQLTALPDLRHLGLVHASAPEQPQPHQQQHPHLIIKGCRARMHALKTLYITSPRALRQLALWTDVPAGLAFTDNVAHRAFSPQVPLVLHELGKGWLAALVSPPAPSLASALPPARDETSACLALRDDASVQHLLQQLDGMEPHRRHTRLSLLLGECVGPGALGRLLETAHLLPQGSVHIANGGSSSSSSGSSSGGGGATGSHRALLGFSLHSQLTQWQLWQLRGVDAPWLCMLQIDACTWMLDQHVALIATAAPALRVLKLAGAGSLTDIALVALLGCRMLEEVVVVGCKELGGVPVAMLLDMLPELQHLVVGNADEGQVRMALRSPPASRHAPVAPVRRWSLLEAQQGTVECQLLDAEAVLDGAVVV